MLDYQADVGQDLQLYCCKEGSVVMAKRGDIAKRRFISWAVNLAGSEGAPEERAEFGFERAIALAELG